MRAARYDGVADWYDAWARTAGAGALAEAVGVLRLGGHLAYVGVHPCFVHPFAEPDDGSVRVHTGYRRAGWAPTTAFTGDAVRARVGVHHLPLADFLSAFLVRGARIERVVEDGDGPLPPLLGVRLTRE